MKKPVFLVLGIVVILSLGISGYLLISKSEAERIEEIWREAQTGDAAAQYSLGQAYIQGNSDAGLEPDSGEAEQWLQKAAVQRHSDAQYALGVFYQSAGDDVGAYAWLSIAASGTNGLASQLREASAKRMTGAQLAEARQMIGQLKGEIK
jgi:TPR repeat protein